MDVRMPDGTIITGVPDNITQTDLLARYNKFATPAEAPKQTGILADAANREAAKEEAFKGVGTTIADLLKMPAASVVGGTLAIPSGAEQGIKGLARKSMEGQPEALMPASVYQPGLDTEEALFGPETDQQKAQRQLNAQRAVAAMPSIPGAKELAKVGRDAQKSIEASISPESKKAIKESQVTGNIFKGEIEFGTNPTVRGYAMQAASVFGSLVPVVVSSIATKSPAVGGGVGGAMAADEAGTNAAEFINKLSDQQLAEQSPFYSNMIAGGASPEEARSLTVKKAAETGAALQGLVAMGGDTFTGKLVTGAFDKLLSKIAGQSALGKTAAGMGLSGLEQGLSETGEGVASDIGTASVVPSKEIGEGSAQNLVMGALGGIGPGALGGLKQAQAEQKNVPPTAEELARSKGFLRPEKAQSTELLNQTVPPAPPAAPTTEPLKAPVSESQDLQAMLDELEGKPTPVKAEEPAPVAKPVAATEESSVVEPVVKESLTPEPVAKEPATLTELKSEEPAKAEPKKDFYQRVDEEVAKIDSAEALVTEFARMRDRQSPLTASSQADPIAVRDALINRLVDKDPVQAGQIAADIDANLAQYSEQSNIPVLKLSSFASSIKKRAEAKGGQAAPAETQKVAAAPVATNLQVEEKDVKGKHDVINTASDFSDSEYGWLDSNNKLHMQYADGTPVKHYAGDKTSTGVTNLTPITTAEEARAAVDAGKHFVTVGPDSAAVKEVAPVEAPAAKGKKAAKPKTNLDKASPLRKAAYAKNPFLTFLADKGLRHIKGVPGSLMSEFNGGKQKMVSGHGPIFKKAGLQIDELLPLAIQDGYLPQGATEEQLYALIQKAFGNNKVEPVYSEQGQEDLANKYEERMAQEESDYEERAGQSDAEWYGMSEEDYVNMMAQEVAQSGDFDAIEEAIGELSDTPASNMSERAAMELLGFTEEEIQNEERRSAEKAGKAAATEKATGTEQGAPTLELETQTAEELKAKQAEVDRLTKENERLTKQAEAKAKADAERDEFVLTGSDRAADVAAAQGQKDIFGAMEEEAPAAETEEGVKVIPFEADATVVGDLLKETKPENNPFDTRFNALMHPVGEVAKPKATEFLTPKEAEARVNEWKAEASRQGKTNKNSGRTILSLFDASGEWSKPWREAGYDVLTFDIQTGEDVNDFSAEFMMDEGLSDADIWGILAAPPCTDFASSGAQYWAKKDASGQTEVSNELVRQVLRTVEFLQPKVWALENPVGRIAKLHNLPPAHLTFDPNVYGDPYTKKTLLWGNFDNNLPTAPVEPTEGSRIIKLSGKDKYARSLTPEGFAYAFFMANNAESMTPAERLARTYYGVDPKAFDGATEADEKAIKDSEFEDMYYDGNLDEAAEIAQEVIGPAEKAAAPQLENEPYTFEGEFTEIGEEEQRLLITDQTSKLSDAQLGSLEKFYGFARDTEEFADAVRQDVVNFITKGATYVNGKIRAIIKSMAEGVLSVAVAFNPQFVSMPYTIAVPQYEARTEQVLQDVPDDVQSMMSDDAKRAYATIYPAIKAELQANDKFFIVADKQTANTFVFNPDGSPFMQSKTLFGAGIGDFVKGNNNIVSNRITPAGLFDLGLRDAKRSVDEAHTAGEYDFGKVFVLDKSQKGANGFYSTTIMHSVWTKEADAKQRLAALQKPGAEDSRYSFGCINVDKATYGRLVTNNLAQMDGAKIFIVPENGTDVMSFVNGEATYSTDIIRQRAEPVTKEVKQEVQRATPKAETDRAVAAKEEDGPVFNSIEPTSNTFTRWTRGLPVVRMGEDHEFKSGEGVVVQSIHATTGDFDTFDRRKGNIESDLGAGFYSTNSTTDAAANYAGMGPDLTTKIERRAEELFDELDEDERERIVEEAMGKPWSELSYEEKRQPLRAMARRELDSVNEGFTMPVFVRFENPVVLGGKGETFLDYNQEYNEETDEYGEPSGTLVDLAMAIREIGEDGSFEMDTEKAVDALMRDMDGMKASDAIASLKDALVYAVDYDTGDAATNEIIRQAFERVGFDGFIDTTVNKKFGSEKRVGKSMAGMTPDTVHFIAFQPNQIKSSIGNRGTYDESGSILDSFESPMITISFVEEEKKRSPSFKRKIAKINRDRLNGKITDEQAINEVDWAVKQSENERLSKEEPEKKRGYLELVNRLSKAAQKGEISTEAFELATWFMRNNELLVKDLGVEILGKGKEGVGGQYLKGSRVMRLIKDAGSNLTVVHEILHHLERMMPVKVQQAIRKAWSKQLLSAQKKAKTPAEQLYFNLLVDGHYGENNFDFIDIPDGEMSKVFMKAFATLDFDRPGSKSSFELAETLLKMGAVKIENYQYFNPSEFWAVNGSDIVQGRFDAVQGGVLARLKNWLKELAEKIKSFVGMNSDASIIRALDSLSKADGTFVTKDMLGEGNYQNLHNRNIYGNPMPSTWDSPEESMLDSLDYKLKDKFVDVKNVQKAIESKIGELSDKFNAYMKEELFHGRKAKRIKDFLSKELEPILQEMKDKDVSLPSFEEYLHMRHAEERNIQIAKINPKMPGTTKDTAGSGISTPAAVKYLANLSQKQNQVFESLASKFDKIIDNTQKILVKEGLETQETIDNWNASYEHYVPLMRDEKELDFVHHGAGVGRGLGTRGNTSRTAFGSNKTVVDIFANVALQRERAVTRAEKARVGRALYGMAIQNPNPGFWLPISPDAIKNKQKLEDDLIDMGFTPADAANIAQEPKVASIDKKTGLVTYSVNPLMRNSDNVYPVRINGQDRFIVFNLADPIAKRMVESLNNLDAQNLGEAIRVMGMVTRWIASVNTQYNPVFGLWNFMRDVGGAAINLSTTKIAGHEKEVLAGLNPAKGMPALRAIYRDLRGKGATSPAQQDWIDLFERYQNAGGQTGYTDQFYKGKDTENIVKREMSKLDRGNVRKVAAAVFDWLSDYNDAMENAVRLSAFKVALDQGLSEEQAASIAKNLTVNFNRKGSASPLFQSLYAFFNASVQGSARVAQTLNGPAGRKIMAGGFAIGVMQALALALAGFDDSDPPEYLKNKNLILPTGGGNYLIIPMPLGYNIFPGLGRIVTEYTLGQAGMITGAKPASTKIAGAASLVLDAFNPLGSGSILQMVSPTIVDPIAALTANRDAFGRPISKEDRGTAPTPGYERSRENATAFSKYLSEFLNWATSPVGTKHTKGFISPTADQIDYFIGQYTGGVGREVIKAGEYAVAKAKGEGEQVPSYRVPLVGKLYGETETPSAISSKFYENVTRMAEHEHEIKKLKEHKEDASEYRKENPDTRFIHRANNLENQITAINKQKKALQEREAPEERIKRLDERKTKLMKDFNDQIKNLERQH